MNLLMLNNNGSIEKFPRLITKSILLRAIVVVSLFAMPNVYSSANSSIRAQTIPEVTPDKKIDLRVDVGNTMGDLRGIDAGGELISQSIDFSNLTTDGIGNYTEVSQSVIGIVTITAPSGTVLVDTNFDPSCVVETTPVQGGEVQFVKTCVWASFGITEVKNQSFIVQVSPNITNTKREVVVEGSVATDDDKVETNNFSFV